MQVAVEKTQQRAAARRQVIEVGLQRGKTASLRLQLGKPSPAPKASRAIVDDTRALPAAFSLRDLALDLD